MSTTESFMSLTGAAVAVDLRPAAVSITVIAPGATSRVTFWLSRSLVLTATASVSYGRLYTDAWRHAAPRVFTTIQCERARLEERLTLLAAYELAQQETTP